MIALWIAVGTVAAVFVAEGLVIVGFMAAASCAEQAEEADRG